MSRLIDTKDVDFRDMAFLIHADGSDYTPYERGYNDAIISCVHRVDNAPTIEEPRWIPVMEKLPTAEDTDNYYSVWAFCKDDGFARAWDYDVVVNNPDLFSHWMPLPSFPKDGDA